MSVSDTKMSEDALPVDAAMNLERLPPASIGIRSTDGNRARLKWTKKENRPCVYLQEIWYF